MRAAIVTMLALVACGPPDVESRDDFLERMEQGARARDEAVAAADQHEVEVSIRAAEEQASIRSETLAELTGQTELDPDAVDERTPMSYEELLEVCGLRDSRCVVEHLAGGPHSEETLGWLADAYGQMGRHEDRMRTLRRLHGLAPDSEE